MRQDQLAARMGVSRLCVSRMETGVVQRPGDAVLDGLALALGRSIEEVHLRAGQVPSDVLGFLQENPELHLRTVRTLIGKIREKQQGAA